jgi:hypothetical protein
VIADTDAALPALILIADIVAAFRAAQANDDMTGGFLALAYAVLICLISFWAWT